MKHIKNYTYHNLMIVIHRIMAKGYTLEEAEPIAKLIFANYNPLGSTIEEMTDRVISKEEWLKEKP